MFNGRAVRKDNQMDTLSADCDKNDYKNKNTTKANKVLLYNKTNIKEFMTIIVCSF